MPIPLIAIIATAAITSVVGEFIKRPISDATEGYLLTEELPARTALKLYIEGVITQTQFLETMRKHNIREDHQGFMLAYAEKEKRERTFSLLSKQQGALAKELERALNDYMELEINPREKELKDIESELEQLKDQLRKVDEAEFAEMAEVQAKEFETSIRILEKQIPAAKPVKA